MERTQHVIQEFRKYLEPLGFEAYPFKVQWYNDELDKEEKYHKYKLNLDPDALAVLVLSTPEIFEKAFVPYIKTNKEAFFMRECIDHHFNYLKKLFSDEEVEIKDDGCHGNSDPMILYQPASHASGAAYFYTTKCLSDNVFHNQEKPIYGVCIHPKYGGWILYRGVFLFKNLLCPELQKVEPIDCVGDQERKITLLKMANKLEDDGDYEEIIKVSLKYSEDYKKYNQLVNSLKQVLDKLRNTPVSC